MGMSTVTAVAAFATLITSSGHASADLIIRANKPVLELFTSQGCSSCPPADRLFQDYVARDDVIALSLSVDYWDYLGWRDTFGHADHSERQRRYARRRGDNRVYTPQIVVNGATHVVGSNHGQIEAALDEVIAGSQPLIQLAVNPAPDNPDTLLVTAETNATTTEMPADVTIWMAMVSAEETVTIRRGENRGQDVRYHNVVRKLKKIGAWQGGTAVLEVPRSMLTKDAGTGCILMMQSGKGGPIVAALELWG